MKDDHRPRLGESVTRSVFHSAWVSRPVGRKEMLSDPEALESIKVNGQPTFMILRMYVNMVMLSKKRQGKWRRFTWLGYMAYVLRNILNSPKKKRVEIVQG